MQFFKRSIYLVTLLLFGGALFADCVFLPSNDFRDFRRSQHDNSWREEPTQDECCPAPDCSPCKQRWLANQIEVGAEALYWKPSYGGVQYGIDVSNTPVNNPLLVEPDWNWGYRVGGRLKSCSENLYLSGSYINFCQSSTKTSVGTTLPGFSDIIVATGATASIRSKYEVADLFIGYRWLNYACVESSIFAGGRYFNIKESENFGYAGLPAGTDTVLQKYRIRGGGPRIGFDFAYQPFSCGWLGGLGFRGMVAQLAGIGTQDQQFDNLLPQVIFQEGVQRFPTTQELLLNTDMRLEAFYQLGFCTVRLQITGGYEFQFYSNARSRIQSAGSIASESNQRESLGYGGPFVGFNLFW